MTYYNTGYIQVEEKDVKALIVAINATEIFGFDLNVTDFYKHCGMAVYDLCEITGDIVNDDGYFEILSPEDAVIRDTNTDDLVKELQKRGYSVTKAGDKNGTENNGNLS